jgi:hypothetical protein
VEAEVLAAMREVELFTLDYTVIVAEELLVHQLLLVVVVVVVLEAAVMALGLPTMVQVVEQVHLIALLELL